MNRTEAKELLPIIQAFAEGKTIEFKNCNGNWDNCGNALIPGFHKDYRIKPETKYRPFKNADECWQEMSKHQPFGWVIDEHGDKEFIGAVNFDNSVFVCDKDVIFLEDMVKHFIFIDGTPFGIRER